MIIKFRDGVLMLMEKLLSNQKKKRTLDARELRTYNIAYETMLFMEVYKNDEL